MRKPPVSVVVLLLVVLMAVTSAVSVVATLAVVRHGRDRDMARAASALADLNKTLEAYLTEPSPAYPEADYPEPPSPETAPPTQSTEPEAAPHESTSADRPAPETAGAANGRPEALSPPVPLPRRLALPPDGPVVMIGGRALARSKHLGNLPAANAVASMDLGDGQRAAIDKAELGFKARTDAQLIPANQKVDLAREAYREAWASGNEQLIDQAGSELMAAAMAQAEALKALGSQYAEAVKPYLTDEQAAQLDRAARQGVPAVVTTSHSGNGPPLVIVNPTGGMVSGTVSVTVSSQADRGGSENEKSPADERGP